MVADNKHRKLGEVCRPYVLFLTYAIAHHNIPVPYWGWNNKKKINKHTIDTERNCDILLIYVDSHSRRRYKPNSVVAGVAGVDVVEGLVDVRRRHPLFRGRDVVETRLVV